MTGHAVMRNGAGIYPPSSSGMNGCGWRQPSGYAHSRALHLPAGTAVGSAIVPERGVRPPSSARTVASLHQNQLLSTTVDDVARVRSTPTAHGPPPATSATGERARRLARAVPGEPQATP